MKRKYTLYLFLLCSLFLILACHSGDSNKHQEDGLALSSDKARIELEQEREKISDSSITSSTTIESGGQEEFSPDLLEDSSLSQAEKPEVIAIIKEKTILPETEPQPEAIDKKERVRLLVTQDNGQEIIIDKEVELLPEETVMDILKAHLEASCSYSNTFVTSINGLKAQQARPGKEAKDWFYYINGNLANVGAASYRPAPGDVICWDYHSWGSGGK